MFYFLFVFVLATFASVIPPFTSFEINASSTGYIMNGSYCQNIDGSCIDCTLVVDTPNNRMAIWIDPFGKWISTMSGVFVWDQAFQPGCFQMTGRTFTDEYLGYKGAQSKPGSKQSHAEYAGFIDVADICGHEEGVCIATKGPYITDITWSLKTVAPLGPGGSNICFPYTAYMEADWSTLDLTSNRDAYFAKPSSCSSPSDYCAAKYPSGNPCYP
jgi:hypothetical protein